MSEDRRLQIVRSALEAINAGDNESFLSILAPDAVSRVVSPLANAGDWTGHDGFLEMMTAWNEAWGDISYELREHESIDERTLLLLLHQEARGAGSGVPVALDVYYVLEFDGDRIVRLEIHADRDSALAAV